MVNRYDKRQLDELVEIIRKDGVISVPTDTLFGICTSINSKIGYKKIISLKKRPDNKLLPIMYADLKQIKDIFVISKREEKIINTFMPGPITLILNKKKNVGRLDNNYKTVAVRMATSSILSELIKRVGFPLFMTSANISGNDPCVSLEEIKKTFPSLDGVLVGDVIFSVASTIVDCTQNELKILRKGPITMEEINKVL